MDLLKIANDKGFVISIQTNATYDFRGIISDLKDFTIKTVFISLYAASKEVHDTITEVLGSFEKTERSIRCLTINDIPVSINCPVMTYNRNEMEGLKKFCDILGIKCNFAFKIIPSQIEDKQTMSLNCFSTNFLKKCINNPVLKLYEAELSMIRKTIPKDRYCQTGFRSITLDAQGNVLLCNAYRKLCGSVKEMQIKDIWENSWVLLEWRNIKSYINKKCLHCEAYAYCEPCPAHTYTLTGKDEEIDEISCAFGKALYCADNF